MVVPQAPLNGCLQWADLSLGHIGYSRSVDIFSECFDSRLTLSELRSRMQFILHSCGCHAGKQRNSHDRGLRSSLPMPYCGNSLLYVDFIHGLPTFGVCDQIGLPGCQVTTGPPQPPAPSLQPEDMPSILPAVAAAEAAAHKPATARIRAELASTTSSSSSASSTSSTSSSDPSLPAALIHKATAKAKAAAARTDPPTPAQASQAPQQRTGKTPDPAAAPSHLRT